LSNLGSLIFYTLMYSFSAFLIYYGYLFRINKIFVLAGLLIPIFIAAFRYDVGSDYMNYLLRFIYAKNSTWNKLLINFINVFEFGDLFLRKTVSLFGERVLYFGVTATIIIIPFHNAVKKQYRKISIGICFFLFFTNYFTLSLDRMRQMMAVSIIFWGLKYVFSGNAGKYFLVAIAAASVHTSALIALPIYFLWDNKKKHVSFLVIIVLFIIGIMLIMNVENIISHIVQYNYFSRYLRYAIDDKFYAGSGFNILSLRWVLLCIIIIIHGKRLIKFDSKNELFILFIVISAILGIAGFRSPLIRRNLLYYEISHIILLANLPQLYKQDAKQIVILIIIAYSVILFVFTYYFIGSSDIIPYKIK